MNEVNTIVSSYNRNFTKRNDGNPATNAFVASPETTTVLAFSGDIRFDPAKDKLKDKDGNEFVFDEPYGDELPKKGYDTGRNTYQEPEANGELVKVNIDENSTRLEAIKPFKKWDGKDIKKAIVLLKARGKCTTDHISMAGPWLKFRGHLDNISNNMLIGAVNDANGKSNCVLNVLNKEENSVPNVARSYKAAGVPWVVVGDENYGEGSSREHAALEPRHLGGRAVIVKSFARIHETNLKKQGMLPLTFTNAKDYDKIETGDSINILGLSTFAPGRKLTVEVVKKDKTKISFLVNHSFNEDQIKWFKAGSALNLLNQTDKNE